MSYETKIVRREGSGPEALTIIPLPVGERRELRISTHKHPWKPVIECEASVVQVSEDGRSFQHVFSLGAAGMGDYRKLLHWEQRRATEKALLDVHHKGLAGIEGIVAAARQHCVLQDARREAQERERQERALPKHCSHCGVIYTAGTRHTCAQVTARLEYLRTQLRAERISYGELADLQGLSAHIEPGDTELLEAAGVPEGERG